MQLQSRKETLHLPDRGHSSRRDCQIQLIEITDEVQKKLKHSRAGQLR